MEPAGSCGTPIDSYFAKGENDEGDGFGRFRPKQYGFLDSGEGNEKRAPATHTGEKSDPGGGDPGCAGGEPAPEGESAEECRKDIRLIIPYVSGPGF